MGVKPDSDPYGSGAIPATLTDAPDGGRATVTDNGLCLVGEIPLLGGEIMLRFSQDFRL